MAQILSTPIFLGLEIFESIGVALAIAAIPKVTIGLIC
jgi:hypothetical protein